ncbi:hypothetical protein PENTCL1PPCAC_16731, partial [Pristionchus entomophagus]
LACSSLTLLFLTMVRLMIAGQILLFFNALFVETSCPFTIYECEDCDSSKLYLVYNTTDDSSMKCDRGYSLQTINPKDGYPEGIKTAACQKAVWTAFKGLPFVIASLPRTQFNYMPDEYPMPKSCLNEISDVTWCANCDRSKLRYVVTEDMWPRIESCRLQCDRGYKLMATSARDVEATSIQVPTSI